MHDPAGSSLAAELEATAGALQSRWLERGDISFDPYDGLEARRVPGALRDHRGPRLALVHLHKRFPVNLRRLFGVRPTRNAYATSHFATATLRLARAGNREAFAEATRRRLGWLLEERRDGAWSYPFDVQTKTYFYPKSVPNVICTVFAGRAFLEAAEVLQDESALEVAVGSVDFMKSHLWSKDRRFFVYLPGAADLIHNANVLAGSLAIRVGLAARRADLQEIGWEALARSAASVRSDGAIEYGEGPHLAWVDNHHTGFVVEGMQDVEAAAASAGVALPVDRMAQFYRRSLFEPDGRPLPALGRRWPIDVISGAQGIQTFAVRPADREFSSKIARFMLARMRRSDGCFRYQRGRAHIKSVPYARWSDAPMTLALATLATALRGARSGADEPHTSALEAGRR